MESNFKITKQSDILLIALSGKLLADDKVNEIAVKVLNELSTKNRHVIFDLSLLEYINSSGINMFMKVLTKARVNTGEVVFFGVKGNVEKLFKIAKLNEIYTIYNSESEAINHFK